MRTGKNDASIIGLHPKSGMIIHGRPYHDSTYRYYGIGEDGECTYIGSKYDVVIGDNGTTARYAMPKVGREEPEYRILLGERDESRAFMVGSDTFLPCLTEENEPVLLLLRNPETGRADCIYRHIPQAWITRDGKISHHADLLSLVETFPGTDMLFIPKQRKYPIPGMNALCSFVNTSWQQVEPSTVSGIPTISIGGVPYYLVQEGKTNAFLWYPQWNRAVKIPSLVMCRITDNRHESFENQETGLRETAYNTFVYPPFPGLSGNIRIVIFSEWNIAPDWSYMWFDQRTGETTRFKDENGNPILIQGIPKTIDENTVAFSIQWDYLAFETGNKRLIPIPKYPGLESKRCLRWKAITIEYHSPYGEVAYDKDGKPWKVSLGNETGYVQSKSAFLGWSPNGVVSKENAHAPDGNIHDTSKGGNPAHNKAKRVHNCYLPWKNTIVPCFFQDGKHVPVFDPSKQGALPLNLERDSISTTTSPDDSWRVYSICAIGKVPWEANNSTILHEIVFGSGRYAIAYGRSLDTLLDETAGRKQVCSLIYIVYQTGTDTLCVPIPYLVNIEDRHGEDTITIDGFPYSVGADAKLLDTWIGRIAEKHIPKEATSSSVVEKKKEAVSALVVPDAV